jgi:rhodanese-related sulfurtransferase
MKRHLLALSLVIAAGASATLAAQAVRNVPRISIDEVKGLMAKKQVVLIDVRDPQSFAEGHMPGAINVPFDFIPDHVDAWKKEKRLLVTYCA